MGHCYCDEHGAQFDGLEWSENGWRPLTRYAATAPEPTEADNEIAKFILDDHAQLVIREVPACTTCGFIGHLADDCLKS